MRPRSLFLIFAAASLGVATVGLTLRATGIDPAAGGPVAITLFMMVGFLAAAWYEGEAAGRGCVTCGIGPVLAAGFCAHCGESASTRASR